MLLDILNRNDYISFNITMAKIFGLQAAIYFSELVNIYQKAVNKNKLIDSAYFKLDRKYMLNRTTISLEDQIQIDNKWMTHKLIEKYNDNPDILKLNINLFISILANEDISVLNDLSKQLNIKNKNVEKETKKQAIIKNLKDSIVCSNYELLTALRNWVDTIMNKPNGFLSKNIIVTFQKTLDTYTKGNLDLALRLVEIATIQGYKDCSWAINIYEKDLKFKDSNNQFAKNKLRVTEQKIASNDTVSNTVFF